MDAELRTEEQEAWQEVETRLEFFVQAFRGPDSTMAQMAGEKLSEAMAKHEDLYVKRLLAEFELDS